MHTLLTDQPKRLIADPSGRKPVAFLDKGKALAYGREYAREHGEIVLLAKLPGEFHGDARFHVMEEAK